jgi:hypothetical protein
MRNLIFCSVIPVALILAACGEQKSEKPVSQNNIIINGLVQRQILQRSEEPAPDWITKKWEISKDEMGKKVIFLTVEGEKPAKEKAAADAESKKIARFTELIKQMASREFAVSKSGVMKGSTDLDAYFDETAASVSRNVNIGATLNVGDYWEYVQDTQGTNTNNLYHIFRHYAMDYENYQKALKMSWAVVKTRLTKEQGDKGQDVVDSIERNQDTLSE